MKELESITIFTNGLWIKTEYEALHSNLMNTCEVLMKVDVSAGLETKEISKLVKLWMFIRNEY